MGYDLEAQLAGDYNASPGLSRPLTVKLGTDGSSRESGARGEYTIFICRDFLDRSKLLTNTSI